MKQINDRRMTADEARARMLDEGPLGMWYLKTETTRKWVIDEAGKQLGLKLGWDGDVSDAGFVKTYEVHIWECDDYDWGIAVERDRWEKMIERGDITINS